MEVFDKVMTPDDGVAWVTGASGGIGRATALKLADRGWTVHATARGEDALAALASEWPDRIVPQPGDVTDLDAMHRIVARITAERPLALALLNAGVYKPMRMQNFSARNARLTFDVNLTGVANCLEPVLEHMVGRGTGHVALTASVAGFRGLPDAGPYAASKAGLIAMAESLAMDAPDTGVRISVINPGFVETEATSVNDFEMPFLMQPEEAADQIVAGLAKPGFEITFPWKFAAILRTTGKLPNRAYFRAIRKATNWSDKEVPPEEA